MVSLAIRAGSAAGIFSSGGIEASLFAYRTSGPAPLAILFHAVDSTIDGWTQDEVYHDADFTFEVVGQTGVSTYSTTSKDRYLQQGGPVASFNILEPGDYTVRVTVDDGLGGQDTAQVAITVTDPDEDFAGTATVVISTSGTFTGAPAGATQRTSSTPGTIASNTRYLFRRGETFSGFNIPMGVSNVYVGAFGSGALPFFTGGIQSGESGTLLTFPHTVVIRDVDATLLGANVMPINWTLYNCNVRTQDLALSGIDFGAAFGYYRDTGRGNHAQREDMVWPQGCHVFECTVDQDTQPANIGISGFFFFGSVVACEVLTTNEHSLRAWGGMYAFYGHNVLTGVAVKDTDRHALKLMSNGNYSTWDPSPEVTGDAWPGGLSGVGGPMARWIVVADNVLGSSGFTGDWIVGIGPQNTDAETVEVIADLRYDNNHHIQEGVERDQDLHICGLRISGQGNTGSVGSIVIDAVTTDEYPTDGTGRTVMRNNYCGPYMGQIAAG